MTYVYQIRNKVTGATYIGSTARFPAGRWAENISTLVNGVHTSSRFQALFDAQEKSLTTWEFSIVDVLKDLSGRELKQVEAEWILRNPDRLRLNMPNQTTITKEKYADVARRIKEGQRYVDIRDQVGVSMGMISRIKSEIPLP